MEDESLKRKKNKFVKDMTEGEPLCLLFEFAIPLLIGNIFHQLYNLTDSIVVGKYLGKLPLGAVGATSSISALIHSLTSGLSVGIGIIVAQFFGAKDDQRVKNTIGKSYYIMFLSSLLMGAIGFIFAGPILNLLKTPSDTFPYAVIYLRTISIGFIPCSIFGTISSILRALGDSKTPLIFSIISCIINIFLDIIIVVKFNMGIMGVGLSTSVSHFISAFLCFIYANLSNSYFRLKIHDFIFNNDIFCKVVKVGIPMALQNSFIALSLIAIQRVINPFGSDYVTSFTIIGRINLFVHYPYLSLGAAIATYTGQNIGAGKEERVKLGYIKAITCSSLFALLIFIIFQSFTKNIIEIFGNDPSVIKIASQGLRFTSTFYVFLGFIHITRNLLNGAGDTRFSMLNGMIECFGRVCFAKPLTMIPFLGFKGIWLTTGITWTLNGMFCVLRYNHGKWKTLSLVNNNKPNKIGIV
jgi:putative MATE family efflux protein